MKLGTRNKYFKAFLNLKPNQIRQKVVISPIVFPNDFGKVIGKKAKSYKSTLGYVVANFKRLTFIKTPMTQGAIWDALILLKDTPCKEVNFLGAIGGLDKGFEIGDVYVTHKSRDIYSVKFIHEETRKKLLSLRRKGIVGIDFESRVFFAAAKKSKLWAKAYYVVTDLPLTKPFYLKLNVKEKERIKESLHQLILSASEPN